MNNSSPTNVGSTNPGTSSLIQEVQDAFRTVPFKSAFGILVLAWSFLFHIYGNSTFGYIDTASLFKWTYHAYNAPRSEDGHGNLIPFVVLILFWWKRQEIAQVRPSPSLIGAVLLFLALVLHWIGYAVQQPRVSIVAYFLGLFGIIGQTWGLPVLRKILFPFVLLGFCIPLGSLADNITVPLRLLVSRLAVGFSQTVLGIDVIREGSLIFDAHKTFRYDVAPACSGIRSLISLVVLSTIYGAITFRTPWKRWLLLLLAPPLAIAGNTLRIILVILAGELFGQEAGLTVEQKLGFITFALAIVVMVLLSKWLKDPELETEPPPDSQVHSNLKPPQEGT